MKKVITRTAEIFMDEFDILHVKMLKGVEMDLGDAIDNYVVVKNITGNRPVLKLIDSTQRYKILKEARELVHKNNSAEKHIAKAVVVGSVVTKHLQNFFLGLINPQFPVKIFTSEAEAMDWLRNFGTEARPKKLSSVF